MAKKRKSAATSLDEVDRTMYASFCSAANSLSQLYTQAMNHQKLSFQAGERQGLKSLLKCDIEILEDVEQYQIAHDLWAFVFFAFGVQWVMLYMMPCPSSIVVTANFIGWFSMLGTGHPAIYPAPHSTLLVLQPM
uniref:Uncharacterized protein n=1 Tax=Quercus lobata TaxID=97700 RepID=A0A7N2QZ23_QUELO